MNILDEIVEVKKVRVADSMKRQPIEQLREEATLRRNSVPPHLFKQALGGSGTNIIAEFKRRSPSKGTIREGADPAEIARWYESGGAVAISVLTEEDYFSGSLEDLRLIRQSVQLPLLRKDFIFDKYQVYEAAVAGADAILLIAAVLDDTSLKELRLLAEDLGMDALVEVHSSDEMERAGKSGAPLIGVNNRDLTNFQVSLETSVKLVKQAPDGCLMVSESGLNNEGDLRRLRQLGFKGFLIGESLMRAESPYLALRKLLEAEFETRVT